MAVDSKSKGWVVLDILEPPILGGSSLEPELSVGLGIPHVGGPDGPIQSMGFDHSDATRFERPPRRSAECGDKRRDYNEHRFHAWRRPTNGRSAAWPRPLTVAEAPKVSARRYHGSIGTCCFTAAEEPYWVTRSYLVPERSDQRCLPPPHGEGGTSAAPLQGRPTTCAAGDAAGPRRRASGQAGSAQARVSGRPRAGTRGLAPRASRVRGGGS